jgi:hypothetical protein
MSIANNPLLSNMKGIKVYLILFKGMHLGIVTSNKLNKHC